jgi:hypothetical protein
MPEAAIHDFIVVQRPKARGLCKRGAIFIHDLSATPPGHATEFPKVGLNHW